MESLLSQNSTPAVGPHLAWRYVAAGAWQGETESRAGRGDFGDGRGAEERGAIAEVLQRREGLWMKGGFLMAKMVGDMGAGVVDMDMEWIWVWGS